MLEEVRKGQKLVISLKIRGIWLDKLKIVFDFDPLSKRILHEVIKVGNMVEKVVGN